MNTHAWKAAAAAMALSAMATAVQAAPVTYTFTSGPVLAGSNAEVSALLGANSTVTGQFTYQSDVALTGNTGALGLGGNAWLYALAVTDLSGTVGGRAFSDATGGLVLTNNNPSPYPYLDTLQLAADVSPPVGSNIVPSGVPRNLAGFDVGAYRLNNVRMLWLSGLGGAGDFLDDTTLPQALPTAYTARLALDFVLASDPFNTANTSYYSRTVFFDGVTVTAVPEPATTALALVGMGCVGLAAVRRRQRRG